MCVIFADALFMFFSLHPLHTCVPSWFTFAVTFLYNPNVHSSRTRCIDIIAQIKDVQKSANLSVNVIKLNWNWKISSRMQSHTVCVCGYWIRDWGQTLVIIPELTTQFHCKRNGSGSRIVFALFNITFSDLYVLIETEWMDGIAWATTWACYYCFFAVYCCCCNNVLSRTRASLRF